MLLPYVNIIKLRNNEYGYNSISNSLCLLLIVLNLLVFFEAWIRETGKKRSVTNKEEQNFMYIAILEYMAVKTVAKVAVLPEKKSKRTENFGKRQKI